MSSVRMCDKCGTVFGENEAGWQTFTASTVVEKEDGERFTKTQHLDACPACAIKPQRQFPKQLERKKKAAARS